MIKKPTGKERREYPRAKRVLSIEYRLIKRGSKSVTSPWQLSTTEDMSLNGILFYTDFEFKLDDIVEIKVTMSGLLDIYQGKARVVRVEKKRAAVHFLTVVKLAGTTTTKKAASKIKKAAMPKTTRKSPTKRSAKRV